VVRTGMTSDRVALLERAVGDFDAAFERLLHAGGSDERRRALSETLDRLYELRGYRESQPPSKQDYWTKADRSRPGCITEGIVALRGVKVHDITKEFSPVYQPLCPSENLAPSKYLSPGANLCWLPISQMRSEVLAVLQSRKKTYPYYAGYVAGQIVLPTLAQAREFLVQDTYLGPLRQ
jgi:hypothetical protein